MNMIENQNLVSLFACFALAVQVSNVCFMSLDLQEIRSLLCAISVQTPSVLEALTLLAQV